MSGMNGVSGSGSMSMNCGMEGMHANSTNKQQGKTQQSEVSTPNTQTNKISDQLRGNTIDLKV
jgi:uncharacterized ferredoxin-like protein